MKTKNYSDKVPNNKNEHKQITGINRNNKTKQKQKKLKKLKKWQQP